MQPVAVNGRSYQAPRRPVVVVCVDGCAPEYLEDGLARGILPHLARFREQGCWQVADCVIPSFTNPNNLSIITGAPPAVHGISGNFFLDPETGAEVMMNEPRFLQAESVLAALSQAGTRVAVVTAKDKLRRLLGHGLHFSGTGSAGGSLCFSAEKADEATLAEHGIENVPERLGLEPPDVYSAELSTYIFEAGLSLLRDKGGLGSGQRPELMYLSTTDYVQHTYAPGEPGSDAFYAALDGYLGALAAAGALVALTADHGMSRKHDAEGKPKVIYLETLLDALLGPGQARVILPITDPYVVHHGALGGFATIYLEQREDAPAVLDRLRWTRGIVYAEPRHDAAKRFGLPPQRLGDLVVISAGDMALGKSPEAHDLSQLHAGLRSHGGLAEQRVPFILSEPLTPEYAERAAAGGLRNFDLLDFALNGVA